MRSKCDTAAMRFFNTAGPVVAQDHIKAKSLRLGDFSPSEVRALLAQHTEETGQGWTAEDTIRRLTQGQP